MAKWTDLATLSQRVTRNSSRSKDRDHSFDDAALGLVVGFDAFHDHAVVQGTEFLHAFFLEASRLGRGEWMWHSQIRSASGRGNSVRRLEESSRARKSYCFTNA